MKNLLFLLFFFCITFATNAQEDKEEWKYLEDRGLIYEGRYKLDSRLTIESQGKLILVNESIQLGDSITVTVAWNKSIEKILLEGEYAYTPTPKEIKKGIYIFRFKPKRTFSFKYSTYFKDENRKPTTGSRVVKVLDKNGQEIKGVDPTEMPRRSNN